MKSKPNDVSPRALVTVFDDLDAAKSVVEHLQREGFPPDRIGLVVNSVKREIPELETPKVHETTESSVESGVLRGAGIGVGLAAGFGAAVTVLTASPGLALGAMLYAGFAGGLIGAMGGADKADLDDSVNLPTSDEYQRLLNDGNSLVVVCGAHDELVRAESILKNLPNAGTHMHRLHGHLFHEHPSNAEKPK